MRNYLVVVGFVLAMITGVLNISAAEPEHFYNPPENLNPDPSYTPGDYALPELHAARVIFQNVKEELTKQESLLDSNRLFTLNAGEITFTAVKNEKAEVLGYFRNFFGALTLAGGEPVRMDLVIDVNSLDTAVPGRNNRILDIFFQSAKPELGTARIVFDVFELGGLSFAALQDGSEHAISASGKIVLNQSEQPIRAALTVQKTGAVWSVTTAQPLDLSIADFNFGQRVYDLMKACNHKALGNTVKIKTQLYLK